MSLASFVLSITLHVALVLGIIFWPSPPPIKLDSMPVQISLVDGAMGGNRAPSPVLGPQGKTAEKIAPPEVAPQRPDAAPPAPAAQETPIAKPQQDMQKPEPKPQPKPEPVPEATPIAEKKKPDVKKEEPKEEAKKEEPKKPEPKKPEVKPEVKKEDPKPAAKPATDPIKDALAKAKAAASREPSPQQGSAVTRALAEAKRKAGGVGGGGGGEGDGPGGGGIGDVYIGQVMMAVRPNWGFPSSSRQNLTCTVRVQVDAQGKILRAELEQSSGNSLFDTSTVNAIRKTGADGQFPVPPSPQYYDLILAFNLNEMAGR